jgi:hypothetical protein
LPRSLHSPWLTGDPAAAATITAGKLASVSRSGLLRIAFGVRSLPTS